MNNNENKMQIDFSQGELEAKLVLVEIFCCHQRTIVLLDAVDSQLQQTCLKST